MPSIERVDARPTVRALVTLLEPPELRAPRALRVARGFELGAELLGLRRLRLLEPDERLLHRVLHELGLLRHRAAGAVDRRRRGDERVAHRTEPTVERAGAVEATTGEPRRAGRRARRAMPSATSAAATASAPRYAKSTRRQRERIVGSS